MHATSCAHHAMRSFSLYGFREGPVLDFGRKLDRAIDSVPIGLHRVLVVRVGFGLAAGWALASALSTALALTLASVSIFMYLLKQVVVQLVLLMSTLVLVLLLMLVATSGGM